MDEKQKKLTITGDIDPVAAAAKLKKFSQSDIYIVNWASKREEGRRT